VVSRMFGPSAVQIIAAAIMVSTFGCANGIIVRRACVLRHGARRTLLPPRGAPALEDAGLRAGRVSMGTT
jgi:hypothetical protein